MTEKEIFDQVFAGMEKQHWSRCTNGFGECVYINGHGYRCPVGHLLTDEEAYGADAIGGPIENLKREGVFPERLMPFWDLLEEMQDLHDADDDWQTSAQLKKHFQLPPVD